MMEGKVLCKECDRSFHNKSNLRRHVLKFHGNKKLNELAPLHFKLSSNFNFTCSECGKNFNHEKHLKFHLKLHGNASSDVNHEPSTSQNKVANNGCKKCPMYCGFSSRFTNLLENHLEEKHNIVIESQNLTFSSLEDFFKWKTKMELETNSKFIKYRYDTKLHTITAYTCHRSGKFESRGKGIRHLKTQGSQKMGAFCPAGISITFDERGSCRIKLTPTHVGHQNDLGHLNLTISERKELAQKIAMKIPFDTILDEISIPNKDLKRLHLLTRKDLHNIKSSFNLSSVAVRHPNDAISIECWVNELKDDVLFFIAQGLDCADHPFLKIEDFVLIIMTAAQCEFLTKYGTDVVCLDGTHGMNAYDFEMQTLLVIDDLREGFPWAFLISNRSDTEIMSLFFSKIKERSGIISAKIFMSDLANMSYYAWLVEMGLPEKRLFCTWHIDRAWRKNLCKIKSKEKQVEVYRVLRTLLEERDVAAFETMVTNFSTITDPEISKFLEYFKQHYINNRQHWAYSYRLNSGINANMHLERMHGIIKYIYLKGKRVKRLGKAIAAIMKFVRNKLINRLIVAHKGKVTSKIKDIRSRHKNMGSLSQAVMKNGEDWDVPSSSTTKVYFIEEGKVSCDCKLICVQCKICIHRYSCSCVDSSIKFNMCKHIHLLCQWREKNEAISQLPEIQNAQTEETDNNSLSIHFPESGTSDETAAIITELAKEQFPKPLEAEKEEIMNNLRKQLNKIQSPSKLTIVKRIMAPLSPTLSATIKSSSSNLPTPPRRATNSKIAAQRRLWSTKRKTKKQKNCFKKPTSVQENTTALLLLNTVVPGGE